MRHGNEGKCYGKWDIRDAACSRCLIYVRNKCEETTKRLMADFRQTGQELVDVDGYSEKEKFNANEHFLRLLEGKLERRINWGDPVVTNIFYHTDGRLAVFAAYHRVNGKMKVRTEKVRKMVTLVDIEQAEELAGEVLKG